MNQAPSSVFMVRPEHFSYNTETADSNTFQQELLLCDHQKIKSDALVEFERFVGLLRTNDIEVLVFDSPTGKQAPDAVFPNNWISMHENGLVFLYPMLTKNRRIERRKEIVDTLEKVFKIHEIVDLSHEENHGRILEGTGSIVFDHINRIAYANESARTNKHLFFDVCQKLDYEGIYFKAVDEGGLDIYHTNVMMTIGDGFTVICKEAIDKTDRSSVINSLQAGGLEIVDISYNQMNHFAGNMIQLRNKQGENILVMSNSAFYCLSQNQHDQLAKYVRIIHPEISTIETVGGGSARCMIAGIHLQKK